MAAHGTGGRPGRVRGQAGSRSAHTRAARLLEPWFAPFALVNGAGVGLTPILLPLVAARYGLGHVGLVMGAFNLGAFAAPLVGSLADHYHTYRLLAAGLPPPPRCRCGCSRWPAPRCRYCWRWATAPGSPGR